MLIKVTDEEIKNGECGSIYGCPVAKALQKAIGKSEIVVTFWQDQPKFRVVDHYYDLPIDIARRIIDYDNKGIMEPFQFEIAEGIVGDVRKNSDNK